MQSADVHLHRFIENVYSNALQRAQLAGDLCERQGSIEFLHQGLQARGEALAYAEVLRWLEDRSNAMPSAPGPLTSARKNDAVTSKNAGAE
jgi:hypothetical protein